MEIVPGVYQIPLPLPFPLKIVYAYALIDGDGWTIVDAGLHYPAGEAAWQAAFEQIGLDPRQIRRIILTHAHPDHYGMAGWLASFANAPVLISPIEQEFVAATWLSAGEQQHAVAHFFRRYGVPEELLTVVDQDLAALRAMTFPAPGVMQDLLPGSEIQIGERLFQVIAVPGHSDGQVLLYCVQERLALCGDSVLMKITPNVGLWPWGEKNPLATFLNTLEKLADLEVALALPGHGALITQFQARRSELIAHHTERLERVVVALQETTNAYQVCQRIFATELLNSHQLRFAMAETLAHLAYLVGVGRVACEGEEQVHYILL